MSKQIKKERNIFLEHLIKRGKTNQIEWIKNKGSDYVKYNPEILILYLEDVELSNLIIGRLFQYENIKVKTIKINNKADYYNLHGTRVDGLYISNKLKEIISNDEILDILEPMLNISIFNSQVLWF